MQAIPPILLQMRLQTERGEGMKDLDWTNYGLQEPPLHPCDTCQGELSEACIGCPHYEEDDN
jgi:hypothetical protein